MSATSSPATGDLLAVGAPDYGGSVGAVFFYRRSGLRWMASGRLLGDGDLAHFGASVALSGDTLAVVSDDGALAGAARVSVYRRSQGRWLDEGDPQKPGGADFSNAKVALDGDSLLVGSVHFVGNFGSSASLYSRHGATWQRDQTWPAPPGSNLYFGSSVALRGDTALVGASNSSAPDSGRVYVYVHAGGSWSLQAVLAPELAEPGFGTAVALGRDVAIVGSPLTGGGTGAAHVFVRRGGSWQREGDPLRGSPGLAPQSFGKSLALEGDRLVVGSTRGASLFARRNGQGPFVALDEPLVGSDSEDPASEFGASVALVGAYAAVGDPQGRGGSLSLFDLSGRGFDRADLGVALAGPECVRVGDRPEYDIAVENRGATVATSIALDVAMDGGGFVLDSLEVDGGTCETERPHCAVARLDPGAAVTLTLHVRAIAAGHGRIRALARSEQLDPEPVDDRASLGLLVLP